MVPAVATLMETWLKAFVGASAVARLRPSLKSPAERTKVACAIVDAIVREVIPGLLLALGAPERSAAMRSLPVLSDDAALKRANALMGTLSAADQATYRGEHDPGQALTSMSLGLHSVGQLLRATNDAAADKELTALFFSSGALEMALSRLEYSGSPRAETKRLLEAALTSRSL